MQQLQSYGSESIKKVLLKHGLREPFFGVKIEYLKKIQKQVKTDYPLALELFDTGNADAMYLAGLITDDMKMTKKDLQYWAEKAYCPYLSEATVAWVAAQSRYGFEMAMEWIDSKKENIAATGWSTLSCLLALTDDAKLDMKQLESLLSRIEKNIHQSPNRVRHTMNGFIIAIGSYVSGLTAKAIATAKKVGAVMVDMGGTACKVPSAIDYIDKVKAKNAIGKKKKTVKC